jgi:hypothetical protein
VDPGTLRREHEGVLAIGNVTAEPLPPGHGPSRRQACSGTTRRGRAREIAVEVRSDTAPVPVDGRGACPSQEPLPAVGSGLVPVRNGSLLAEAHWATGAYMQDGADAFRTHLPEVDTAVRPLCEVWSHVTGRRA